MCHVIKSTTCIKALGDGKILSIFSCDYQQTLKFNTMRLFKLESDCSSLISEKDHLKS